MNDLTLTELIGLTMNPIFNLIRKWRLELALHNIEHHLMHIKFDRDEGFKTEGELHKRQSAIISQLRDL